ncbi:RHS repeat-associated core domain-containing protein [Chloroflexota bacterium]
MTYLSGRDPSAPYTIYHTSGSDTVVVDQTVAADAGQWQLLGIYQFNSGTGSVVLTQEDASYYTSADAIRFVKQSPAANFVYDGDGNRVLKTEGGETTLYVNQYYEKNLTTDEVTTHYYLGGRQIAYKTGDTLEYPLDDHLLSTVGAMNSDGEKISTIKYFPFGDCRNSTGNVTTDKLFTGQRLDDTGLYFYNARYYDATIGRFISADTIVPDPFDPQGWNRYSYCENNPLIYIDPTGHFKFKIGIPGTDIGVKVDTGKVVEKTVNAAKAVGGAVVDAGKTTCEFVAFSAKNMTTAEYWGDVGDMFLGYGDAAVNTVTGLADMADMVQRPWANVDEWKGLANVVTHPGETLDAIGSNYAELAKTDRGRGQIVGEGLITLATIGAGPAIKGSAEAGHLTKVSQSIKTAVGPRKNWVRYKESYSRKGGFYTERSLSWGASPVYASLIGNPLLRWFNQVLRNFKLPGSSWRVQDAGHFHVEKK